MPSWQKPTPEQVSKATSLMKRRSQTAYFFDRLDNPRWLGPLAAEGMFKAPPDIQFDESGERWSAPPWPQGRYLARMASLAPEEVHRVIERIPESGNPLVRGDIVDALKQLPGPLAASMTKRVEAWCAEPYLLLAEKIRELIAHLAAEGEAASALRLAGRLLKTRPVRTSGGTPLLFPEAVSVLDQWEYGRVLDTISGSVVPAAGVDAALLLRDLLMGALSAASRTDRREADHLSYVWRSAVEDHEQNSPAGGIKSMLVSALRDACVWLVENDRVLLPELLEKLDRTDSTMMQRLCLHMLTRFVDREPDLAIAAMVRKEFFDAAALRHEYYELSAVAFPRAPKEAQEIVLSFIDAGADREAIIENWRSRTGQEPDPKDVDQIVRVRQLTRLQAFADALSGENAERHASLIAELGTPNHPDFLIWHGSIRHGDTSPVAADDLAGMPAADAIEYVIRWEPQPRPDAPTRTGLSQQLRLDVASRPDQYLAGSARLLNAHPTFLRAFVEGLDDAAKAGRPFDTGAALSFEQEVLVLPETLEREVYIGDQDPGLNWTRRAILEFILGGLEREGFTAQHESAVLQILDKVSNDPDPGPDAADSLGGRAVDIAINSIRGRAVEVLVAYAKWLVAAGIRPIGNALSHHPVGEVLARRLDLEVEPSLPVRSIFGLTLSTVYSLDVEWLRANLDRYFPAHHPEASRVVWDAYLGFSPASEPFYRMLERQYLEAIARMPAGPAEPGRIGSDYRLAEHLVHLHLGGTEGLDEPISLLFARADLSTRAHAIEYAGRLLHRLSQDSPKLTQTARDLWTSRRESVLGGNETAELVPFAWWFASAPLDPTWRFDEIKRLLEAGVVPEPGFVILQTLKGLAAQHSRATLEALTMFLDRDRPGVIAGAFEDEIAGILEAAMANGDANVKRIAVELAHRLGEFGYSSIRHLTR